MCRHAAETSTQPRTSARANHNMIDAIVAGVVDELASGVGGFHYMIGDVPGRNWNRPRPMLEFGKTAEMRISSLAIFELVKRQTRNFQHVNAGKACIRLGREYAPHRLSERLVHGLMAGLKINRCQDDRCIGKISGQGATLLGRAIARSPHPVPRGRANTLPAK